MLKRRKRDEASLQITSLMDAMTILLLFLLKNLSTEGVILTNADDLVLPLSDSKIVPQSMSKQIAITPKNILFDNKPVAKTEEVRRDSILGMDYQIKGLGEALKKQYELENQMVSIGAMSKAEQGQIIIQADKNTEYDIIYKVILTCGNNYFTKIKLAVMERDNG